MFILKEEDEVRCKKVVFDNSLLHESISKRRHHPVGRQKIAMDEKKASSSGTSDDCDGRKEGIIQWDVR